MTEIKSDGRLQGIQIRLTEMKDLVSQLDKAIIDKEAKEFLLGTATNWLGDVEGFLIPQGQVAGAELTLTLVERCAPKRCFRSTGHTFASLATQNPKSESYHPTRGQFYYRIQ